MKICYFCPSKYYMCRAVVFLFLLSLIDSLIWAEVSASQIVKNITAEGSCAIVGMTAEQCRLLGSAAIEQAVGIRVTSTTLVHNSRLASEFIRTYAKGFIVKEKAEWLPISRYQKNSSTPPTPEYTVKITADIQK